MGQCAATGCEEVVDPSKLMCLRHWRMVSRDTQNAVYDTWRNVRRDPEAYLEAKREAIAEVGQHGGAHHNPNQGSLFG